MPCTQRKDFILEQLYLLTPLDAPKARVVMSGKSGKTTTTAPQQAGANPTSIVPSPSIPEEVPRLTLQSGVSMSAASAAMSALVFASARFPMSSASAAPRLTMAEESGVLFVIKTSV